MADVPIGALFLSDETGVWLFGSVLAVFGGIQMMIGFEQDEKWRRIYTLVAIPVGILIIAEDISNGVLQGVMYLLAALTLFGQGFLYMNRAGVMVSGTAAHSTLVTENIVAANTMVTKAVEVEEPQQDEVVEEDVETLKNITQMLDLRPIDLVRKGEKLYQDLDIGKYENDADALLKVMTENPILIERPIVIANNKAIIGRPPELILNII